MWFLPAYTNGGHVTVHIGICGFAKGTDSVQGPCCLRQQEAPPTLFPHPGPGAGWTWMLWKSSVSGVSSQHTDGAFRSFSLTQVPQLMLCASESSPCSQVTSHAGISDTFAIQNSSTVQNEEFPCLLLTLSCLIVHLYHKLESTYLTG